MLAALRFDREGRPYFEPATNVRLSVVCAVANTVTDHFQRLLDRDLAIDVFEPRLVPLGSQPTLFSDAYVYLAHGRRSDLLVVLRKRDANRLCACAFHEDIDEMAERGLSSVEEQVLERIARELARHCTPLCGEITSFGAANGPVERYECATYFELRISSPVDVTIGLGLSRDPAPPAEAKLAPKALDPIVVALRARLARARVPAREVMSLAVGSIIPFETMLGDPASLMVGDAVVATGECGVVGNAMAFHVTSIPGKTA
jgi:flagellar motor switch/type III secretory pathway protein FliN